MNAFGWIILLVVVLLFTGNFYNPFWGVGYGYGYGHYGTGATGLLVVIVLILLVMRVL